MIDANIILIIGCTVMGAVNIVQFFRRGRPATLWLAAAWLMLMGFWLFQSRIFSFGAGMFLIFGLAAQFMPMITKQPETIIENPLLRQRLGLLISAFSLMFVLIISVMYHNALKNHPRLPRENNPPVASIFHEKAPVANIKSANLLFNIPADMTVATISGPAIITRGKHPGWITFNLNSAAGTTQNLLRYKLTITGKNEHDHLEISAPASNDMLTIWLKYGLAHPVASELQSWSATLPEWRSAFKNALFSGIPASTKGNELYDIKLAKTQFTIEFTRQQPFFSAASLPVSNSPADKLLVRVSNLVDIEGNKLPDALVFSIPTTRALLTAK